MRVHITAREVIKYGYYMCTYAALRLNAIDTVLRLRSLFKSPLLIAEVER
jgi:hypothetical protein